jgi:hypothetical protein
MCTPGASALASRLVIAGGGGGGGNEGDTSLGGPGGDAGGAGTAGSASFTFKGGGGGQAGGQNAGGEGGTNGAGGNAPSGQLGVGGNGQDGNVLATAFGGGGGGGLYGGGGGGLGEHGVISNVPHNGGGGGGGGGSSGVPTGASGVSGFATDPTPPGSEPKITFTWTLPPPAAATGSPTTITGTSATLNGTVNPDGSVVSDCHFTVSNGTSVPCLQQVGSGSTPSAVTASLTGLEPGHSYTVTLVAASAQGTSTGAPVTFTTAHPPAVTLSGLRVTPRRLHHAKKKHPSATTISFGVSQAATVKLTFAKRIKGRRVGKRCSATKHHGKRCTAYKPIKTTVTLNGAAGENRLTVPGKKLRPGTYRLSVAATSATGQHSNTLTASLTILR